MNSTMHCRSVFILALGLLSLISSNAFAYGEEWVESRNCVDRSIVKFLEESGLPVTQEAYENVLNSKKYEINPKSRNMSEALEVLNGCGLTCIAFQASSEAALSFSGISIVFVQIPERGAHCVFFDNRLGKHVIHDKEPYTINQQSWSQLGEVILVVSYPTYFWMKLKEFVGLVLLGFVGGVIALVAFYGVRSRFRYKTTTACAWLSFSLLVLGAGCKPDRTSDSEPTPMIHDFGVIKGTEGRHSFRLSYSESRTIDRVIVSCGCMGLGPNLAGTTIHSGSVLEIPVKVELRNKTGEFVEQIQVVWKDRTKEPQFLEIKGFAIKDARVYPDPVVLKGTTSTHFEAPFEVVLAHGYKTQPRLLSIELEESSKPILKSSVVDQQYARETWSRPDLGVVRLGQVAKFELAQDLKVGETIDLKATLRWSEPELDRPVAIRVNRVPPLQFADRRYWLNFQSEALRRDTIPVVINEQSLDPEKVTLEFSEKRLAARKSDLKSPEFQIDLSGERGDSFTSTCKLLLDGVEIDSIEILVN